MSAAQLRKRLARLDTVLDSAIPAAAEAVEEIAAQEGGTVILGRKRRRVKLKAVSRVKGRGDHVTVTVWGKPTGPWVWVTSGAKAHTIPRKPPTARRPRPMKGGLEHPVQRVQLHHPGRRGTGNWHTVVKRAKRIVPEIITRELSEVIRRG